MTLHAAKVRFQSFLLLVWRECFPLNGENKKDKELEEGGVLLR